MRRRVAAPLLGVAAALGCAQPGSPPGGEIDRSPPRVVEVTPAAFDTLTDLDEPVVIRFNERVSERIEGVARWEDAVLVSPVTSPVQVDAGRRDLKVSLVRGWEANQVYRVVVLPVFRDLFGNIRVEPVELVFSTGAPIPDAALAGFVRDRITGQPAVGARVEALRRIDSMTYVAKTDTGGFFSLRYVPAGAYDVRAWQDQNRDRIVDFFEVQDSLDVAFGVRDTAVVELALLPRDSTAARLIRAEPIDSGTVRLAFDDYFAPGPVEGQASVYALADSTRVGSGRLLHGSRLDSLTDAREEAARQAAEREAADREAAERQAAGDTAAAPTDEGVQAEESEAAEGRRPASVREPLPSRELILLVPGLLRPDSAYYVVVEGVTNIQGLPGGGGSVPFVAPPAPEPPPDSVPADSVAPAPPDTVPAGPVPDTGSAGERTVPGAAAAAEGRRRRSG